MGWALFSIYAHCTNEVILYYAKVLKKQHRQHTWVLTIKLDCGRGGSVRQGETKEKFKETRLVYNP
jgi:hypothetical protein